MIVKLEYVTNENLTKCKNLKKGKADVKNC